MEFPIPGYGIFSLPIIRTNAAAGYGKTFGSSNKQVFLRLQVVSDSLDILGGFLQFSILHPCFNPPHRRVLRDEDKLAYAVEVGDYFVDARGHIDEWSFSSAPEVVRQRLPKFKVPRFHRPLAEWVNLLLDTGFTLERLAEPNPSFALVNEHAALQDAQVVAYFLHVRVRKPA